MFNDASLDGNVCEEFLFLNLLFLTGISRRYEKNKIYDYWWGLTPPVQNTPGF